MVNQNTTQTSKSALIQDGYLLSAQVLKEFDFATLSVIDLPTPSRDLFFSLILAALKGISTFRRVVADQVEQNLRDTLTENLSALESNMEYVAQAGAAIREVITGLPSCEEEAGAKKLSEVNLKKIQDNILALQSLGAGGSELITEGDIIAIIKGKVLFPAIVVNNLANVLYAAISGELTSVGRNYAQIANSARYLKQLTENLPPCMVEGAPSAEEPLPEINEPPPLQLPEEPEPIDTPEPQPEDPSAPPPPSTDKGECQELIEALENFGGKGGSCDLTPVLQAIHDMRVEQFQNATRNDILIRSLSQAVSNGRTEAQQNARRNDSLLRRLGLNLSDARTEAQQNARRNDELIRRNALALHDIKEQISNGFNTVFTLFGTVFALLGLLKAEVFAVWKALSLELVGLLAAIKAGFSGLTVQLSAIQASLVWQKATLGTISQGVRANGSKAQRILNQVEIEIKGDLISDDLVPKDEADTIPGFVPSPGFPSPTIGLPGAAVTILPRLVGFGGVGLVGLLSALIALSLQLKDLQGDVKGDGGGGDLTTVDIEIPVVDWDFEKDELIETTETVPVLEAQEEYFRREFEEKTAIKKLLLELRSNGLIPPISFPDWWQLRHEAKQPQIVYVYAMENLDKRNNIDRNVTRQVQVPYPREDRPPAIAPLPEFTYGDIDANAWVEGGIIRVHAVDEQEVLRMYRALLPTTKRKLVSAPKAATRLTALEKEFELEPEGIEGKLKAKTTKEEFIGKKFIVYYADYYPEGIGEGVSTLRDALKIRKYYIPFQRQPRKLRASNVILPDEKRLSEVMELL